MGLKSVEYVKSEFFSYINTTAAIQNAYTVLR